MVVAKTVEGEIGVLADHEPLMAALATGAVEITHAEGKTAIGVHGGFLQVLENHVTLLTDRAQLAEGDRGVALEVAVGLAAEDTEARASEAEAG